MFVYLIRIVWILCIRNTEEDEDVLTLLRIRSPFFGANLAGDEYTNRERQFWQECGNCFCSNQQIQEKSWDGDGFVKPQFYYKYCRFAISILELLWKMSRFLTSIIKSRPNINYSFATEKHSSCKNISFRIS